MEVDQSVGRDSVEGQSPSRTVHIHSYSVRDRGGGDGCFFIIVPDRVTVIRASQTPGLIIPSKPGSPAFPWDPSVSHCYVNISFPLNFPVTTTSQAIFTQHLAKHIKSLWVIRIRLLLLQYFHPPVVVKQFQVFVCGVQVQC